MPKATPGDDGSRELRQLRVLRIAAAVVGSAGMALILLAFLDPGHIGALWGLGALAIACALGVAWVRQKTRVQALAGDRFFARIEQTSEKRRPAEPHGRAQSLIEEVREEPIDWVDRLAMRSARLRRFVELHAPERIIEDERRLVRQAIAKVDPAVALSILGVVGTAQRDDFDESDPD